MAAPNSHVKKNVVIPDDAYFHFSWIIPLTGGILFTFASYFIDESLGGFVLWLAIYFAWGFKIIQNTDYVVIERFGEFSRIVHSGPRILCLPGLIDKIGAEGTLRNQSLALFASEGGKPYIVDFRDGSSPVVMTASFCVGPQGNTVEEIDNAIYRYTYTMKNQSERNKRIEEVLESATIPLLQALEISGALLEKDTIAEKVTADQKVRDALEKIGIELNPQKGLIISDIDLPPEIIEQRQKKLQGASEAEKQSAQGLGYARSIQAIMTALNVDQKEARSIYETQRSLEVLGSLDANVSFVAGNMKDIQRTMGVGDANPRNHQPKQRRASS